MGVCRLRAAATKGGAIASAANGQTIHCEVETKQGERAGKKLELTVRPVGEEGQPLLLIMEGTTVGDRQQLESSLHRCQRLKSVGEQTLEMINDFKNLLAPLSAIATLLHLEFPEADRSQRELFQIIATSTHRANTVMQQMLTYVKGDQAHYTTLEADCLMLDIQSLLEPTFVTTQAEVGASEHSQKTDRPVHPRHQVLAFAELINNRECDRSL